MKEKKKLIFETRLKEIEAMDRDITNINLKWLFGLFAAFGFSWVQGLFEINRNFIWIFVLIFAFLLIKDNKENKQIFKIYNSFVEHIKKDNIENFNPEEIY